MSIALPANATVFTLVGLNFNTSDYMPDQLRGIFKSKNYTLRKVDYPASILPSSIRKGEQALDFYLRNTEGPKIVFAHSQGAQVCSRWMRNNAVDPTAPRDVTFLLTGNPLRNATGRTIGRMEGDGRRGLATPTDLWRVIDVARARDGWAISSAGMWGALTIHPRYENVDLFSPKNAVTQRGNTTFVTTS